MALAQIIEDAADAGGKLERDMRYMRLALEQAEAAASLGEVPIGAVVVLNDESGESQGGGAGEAAEIEGRRRVDSEEGAGSGGGDLVVARACNRREIDANPAAHAEFLAIEEASQKLGRWRLFGCTVYVTLEPCLMCAGLMYQARIDRCVFATPDPKAGALGTLYNVAEDERLNHRFEVTGGILAEESARLLQGFFAKLRK